MDFRYPPSPLNVPNSKIKFPCLQEINFILLTYENPQRNFKFLFQPLLLHEIKRRSVDERTNKMPHVTFYILDIEGLLPCSFGCYKRYEKIYHDKHNNFSRNVCRKHMLQHLSI